MKRNLDYKNDYNQHIDKALISYIDLVRRHIDYPTIFIPYIKTNADSIIEQNITYNKNSFNNVTDDFRTYMSVKLEDGISDNEKRKRFKETVNLVIDLSFDAYEIWKEDNGINKDAGVNKSKEVERARKRLAKYKNIYDALNIKEKEDCYGS